MRRISIQEQDILCKVAPPESSLHSFTSNACGRDIKIQDVVVGSCGSASLDAKKPQHIVETTQGSFGVQDTTGAFRFSPSLLGFITTPKSQTMETGFYDAISKKIKSFALRRSLQSDLDSRLRFLDVLSRPMASTIGFKTRTYKSGESAGGLFYTGRESKSVAPERSGILESTELTNKARVKIRRAVECSDTFIRYFWTLTFSPEHCHAWQKNIDGCVRHDFAKYKIKKYLDTCRHKQKRLNRELSYLWVAELQKNGNIHFHILMDQFFDIKWATKTWAQAANSVDVAPPLKNPEHAANYIRKYMSKGENSLIQGNRYNISSKLHLASVPKEKILMAISKKDNHELDGEPVKEMLNLLHVFEDVITERGGNVFAYGYHVQRGRSAKKYKDKKTGEEKESKAVHPRLGRDIINILSSRNETGYCPF